MPGGVAKKINVSFDETEKQFNKEEKTLEDIIDEELANEPEAVDEEPTEEEPIMTEATEESVEIPRASVGDVSEPELAEEKKEVEEVREPVVEERPIRASKKKSGKGLIVFLIILIILLVAGFAVYYCLSTGVIKNDLFAKNEVECVTKKADPVETTKVVEFEEEQGVIEVVNGIRDSILSTSIVYDSEFINTYNYNPVFHKINDDGVFTPIEKTFGLYIDSAADLSEEQQAIVNNSVIEKLKTSGFEDYYVTITMAGNFLYYLNTDSGIICGGTLQFGNPWYFSCANENWASADDDELSSELMSALKPKTANSEDWTGAGYSIWAKKSDIETSSDGKYQRIMVGIPNAMAVFYRENKDDAEWQFVTAGQAAPACSEFDEEAKEAFAEKYDVCIDENGEPIDF